MNYTKAFYLTAVGAASLSVMTACAAPVATKKPATTKPAAKPAPQPKVVTTTPTLTDSGIPIRFPLDKPAYVTLVIEDATGKRVRNLIAETQLPAGDNLITWDGYDDGTRNEKGDLVRRRVAAGQYRVRGLTHTGIRLNYEFPLYSGGNPPWKTADRSGAWMADHSAPMGAVFLPAGVSPYGKGKPQVLLSSLEAEAGDPLIMVDETGQRIYGEHFFGWQGGIAVTRDMGTATDPDLFAYAVTANEERVVLRALRKSGGGVEVASVPAETKMPSWPGHSGISIAVYNGLAVVSMPLDNKLVFIDTKERKILGSSPLPSPRGVYFDAKGNLFAISNNTVKRFRIANSQEPKLDAGTVLIDDNLVEAHTLTGDSAGNLYVADWGKLSQVKVFSADGTYRRVIGKPGGPQLGLYDEQRMHNPQGLTIDDKGRLWIAEADHLPKRISVWNATSGKFEMAKYGPPRYGGGGTIDPLDPTRAFYQDHQGLIEFELDWKAGTSKVKAIPVRGGDLAKEFGIEYGNNEQGDTSRWGFVNERPVQIGGRTYLTGSWQGGLRSNDHSVIWLLGDDHIARPVARIGGTSFAWPPRLNQAFMSVQPKTNYQQQLVAWADLNGNHRVDAEEYTIRSFDETYTDASGETRPMDGLVTETVFPDLSATTNWGLHVPAPTFNAKGVPIYDLAKASFLVPHDPVFRFDEQFYWGHQVLPMSGGWVVAGLTGWKDQRKMWSYPTVGNDVSRVGGEINQPTRLLGPPMNGAGGQAGDWYATSGERGNIFLVTSDGLYLQTLGGDMRTTPLLRFPVAKRGMVIDGPEQHISFEDEHFHPTMTQTKDGTVYLVAGKEHSSIFRVTGWDSVKRRDFASLNLVQSTLASLPATKTTVARQQGRHRLKVATHGAPLAVDGQLTEWQKADWATISHNVSGAVAVSNDTLYAAWKTGDDKLLSNSGTTTNNLFKGGGALDLMIGTDGGSDHARREPVAGDLRLLITRGKGQPRATLYRAVVPGTADAKKVLFDSPVGRVLFDEVRDVSAQIKLAQQGGNYEISVPLQLLGMKPEQGSEILGDIGVLRGDGSQTIQRLYWNNLNTAIVSDIPAEARLQPINWGIWKIVADAQLNDGSVALLPQAAKLVGDNIRLKKEGEGEDAEYSIGFWDNPNASLQWQVAVPKAGKYRVELTYGSGTSDNDFTFTAGAQKLTGRTVNTGGWDRLKTVQLGEVTLPAGQNTFALLPPARIAIGLMDFKILRLVPVK